MNSQRMFQCQKSAGYLLVMSVFAHAPFIFQATGWLCFFIFTLSKNELHEAMFTLCFFMFLFVLQCAKNGYLLRENGRCQKRAHAIGNDHYYR